MAGPTEWAAGGNIPLEDIQPCLSLQKGKDTVECFSEVTEERYNCAVISHFFTMFMAEARKGSGDKYPLNQILFGILQYMHKNN